MQLNRIPVQYIEITEENIHQRIDNFLLGMFKHLPKSVVYKIIRKGEVRINKKRVKPIYKLKIGDIVRVPPLNLPDEKEKPVINPKLKKVAQLQNAVVYEDEQLLILNKPSGLAVHGGSGLKFGAIEALRALRPNDRYLELIHRIDRDTSGLLMVAKKRSALRRLQQDFREKNIHKYYYALVMGKWDKNNRIIDEPLLKNEVNSIVRVNSNGKPSKTKFKIIEQFKHATLVDASPITGRTHQIRVHAQYTGHPIAWDNRYGDQRFDAYTAKSGLNRLFLHAHAIDFTHPTTNEQMRIEVAMDKELIECINYLRKID